MSKRNYPAQGGFVTPPQKRMDLLAIRDQVPGLNVDAQKTRFLAALQRYSVSTFEASRYLDIYYPPARVSELRSEGFKIITERGWIETEAGVTHLAGIYVLLEVIGPMQACFEFAA